MKTIGPMNAQSGNTEISVVFSVDTQKLHAILMAGDIFSLNNAINDFISEELGLSHDALFTSIRDFVLIRQAQLEATSR